MLWLKSFFLPFARADAPGPPLAEGTGVLAREVAAEEAVVLPASCGGGGAWPAEKGGRQSKVKALSISSNDKAVAPRTAAGLATESGVGDGIEQHISRARSEGRRRPSEQQRARAGRDVQRPADFAR